MIPIVSDHAIDVTVVVAVTAVVLRSSGNIIGKTKERERRVV